MCCGLTECIKIKVPNDLHKLCVELANGKDQNVVALYVDIYLFFTWKLNTQFNTNHF